MILRENNILSLLDKKQSILVLGPRGTGKSTFLREVLKKYPNSMEFDLLEANHFSRFLANPKLIVDEIEFYLKKNYHSCTYILIDEIQKIPLLLDEVHRLIEKFKSKICFILSGSSARKLKAAGSNLLAGRAISLRMHAFSYFEIKNHFNLQEILLFGGLPLLWDKDKELKVNILKTYVDTYIREEILQESIVRNIESFILFLDLAAQLNGETINYSKIAKQCNVSSVTVKQYFQILSDTLLATFLPGWSHSIKKQIIKSPKFYLFDTGVINTLQGELQAEIRLNSNRGGKIFETFIINEIKKIIDTQNLFLKMFYWKTKTGQEVDLILSKNSFAKPTAFEIKSSQMITEDDLKSLIAFKQEEPKAKLYCICNCENAFEIKNITVLPWRDALSDIANGKII